VEKVGTESAAAVQGVPGSAPPVAENVATEAHGSTPPAAGTSPSGQALAASIVALVS
jgi:hypothetical protein